MMTSQQTHIQLVQHLRPGGIESLVLDLCQFAQEDRQVHIVSLEGSKAEALAQWPRLAPFAEQLTFLSKPAGIGFSTVLQLSQLLKQKQVERLHTHHIGPMLYGSLAAKMAGVKQWIHTEHDAWHLDRAKHRHIAQWCVRAFNPLMVADAGLVAEQMQVKLPGIQAHVIYNGIDTDRFTPGSQTQARTALGLPLNHPMVGCAARLHPVKGQARLIQLMTKFPDNVHLALAGDGPTKESLLALANALGIAHRVHFLGAIDDMPAFYRAIDVFCLASDFEGLPLSPLEAQACNTPVVVTDVGGARETVCPATGHVVALDDANGLNLAVTKLLMYPTSESPRHFVQRHYDVRVMIAQYNQLADRHWSRVVTH